MFDFSKKGIGPIIAVTLLFLVAVIAVAGYDLWFKGFSSMLFVDIEKGSQNSIGSSSIEGLIGNTLYIKNSGDSNLSIQQVKINDIECNISRNISSNKIEEIDVSACVQLVGEPNSEITVISNKKVESKYIYNKNYNQNLNEVVVPFTCTNNTVQGFYNGSGSLIDPWLICNCTMLQNMNLYLTANFALASNVDCGVSPYNVGLGFKPIGNLSNKFEGTLDGKNYNINNLYINRPLESEVGLFSVTNQTSIYDLSLLNVNIVGNQSVGAVAGIFFNSDMENIFVSGNVSGNNSVGGVIGTISLEVFG